MFGKGPCPLCGNNDIDLLATDNEWRNYCPKCDYRFNDKGVVLSKDGTMIAAFGKRTPLTNMDL